MRARGVVIAGLQVVKTALSVPVLTCVEERIVQAPGLGGQIAVRVKAVAGRHCPGRICDRSGRAQLILLVVLDRAAVDLLEGQARRPSDVRGRSIT